MQICCSLQWFLVLPPMSPVWAPLAQEGGGLGGLGSGRLQVCLESQTVLHFPSVSLQLSLVNERGSGQTDQRGGSENVHTHIHKTQPNVPNVFRVCTLTRVWRRGHQEVSCGLIGLEEQFAEHLLFLCPIEKD